MSPLDRFKDSPNGHIQTTSDVLLPKDDHRKNMQCKNQEAQSWRLSFTIHRWKNVCHYTKANEQKQFPSFSSSQQTISPCSSLKASVVNLQTFHRLSTGLDSKTFTHA